MLFSCFALLLLGGALYGMEGQVEKNFPNRADVSWLPVEGADHYDLYVNRTAIQRVDASQLSAVVGGDDSPLESETDYQILIVARDEGENVLDSVTLSVTTGSWDGTYRWENRDKKDNKGKCKAIEMEIKGDGVVLLTPSGRHVVAPVPASPSFQECPADDDVTKTVLALFDMFNTTDYPADGYRILSETLDATGLTIVLEMKCKGITVPLTAVVGFSTDEGSPVIRFSCRAKGIADMVIFKNPEKKSKGVFVLRKV